jgi:peptide deformylase
MAIKEIVTIPDPVLRRKAHKVTVFDKDFQTFVDDMVDTLRDAPGVGLAAPQVGVSQRLIVVEYSEDEDEEVQEDKPAAPKKLYIVANPEIIAASEETENGIEGCLSVPDLVGEVERSLHLTVKGLNRRGKPVKIKADGWLARIFQHEIDHLDGVIFTDKALKVWQPREDEKVSD